MSSKYTVFMETDEPDLDADQCVEVQEAFHEFLGASVGCPGGFLACTLTLTSPTLQRAVLDALALFSEARGKAAVAARVIALECYDVERPPHSGLPPLISVSGLAKLFGTTPAYVRKLLGERGCPVEPVSVEGGERATVYVKGAAMAWLGERLGRTQAG